MNNYIVELPECRLGGNCELVSRADMYGWGTKGTGGFAQCIKCSIVYEAVKWEKRICHYCKLQYGESPHDPCIGYIEGETSVCCGHGKI